MSPCLGRGQSHMRHAHTHRFRTGFTFVLCRNGPPRVPESHRMAQREDMDPDTSYLFYVPGVAITQITLVQGPGVRLRESDELGSPYLHLTADHRTLMFTELSATLVHGSAPCTVE